MARTNSTIVRAFTKEWDGRRFKYAPRPCPYCRGGRIMVDGASYECALCEGTNTVFRDGYPDVEEKLFVAAPTVYVEHVKAWSKSLGRVAAGEEELPF